MAFIYLQGTFADETEENRRTLKSVYPQMGASIVPLRRYGCGIRRLRWQKTIQATIYEIGSPEIQFISYTLSEAANSRGSEIIQKRLRKALSRLRRGGGGL